MKPYSLKKPSYICKVLFLSFFFFLNLAFGQDALRLHFVSTDKKARLSPEVSIQIQQFSKAFGVEVEIEQLIHPLSGKLPKINYLEKSLYFTGDMRFYRDQFFTSNHPKTTKDYYIFLTPDKIDSLHAGFSLPGKHILFIASNPPTLLAENFARHFVKAAINQKGNYRGALDSLSKAIGVTDTLKMDNASFYLFHDETENIGAKNGMVAFAFWGLSEDGSITDNKVALPFKRNYGKVNLDLNSYWLRPFYSTRTRFIAPIHVGLVLLTFFIMLIFRKRVKNKAETTVRVSSKLGYFFLRLALWMVFLGIGFGVFLTTNEFYKKMLFNSSEYTHVGNKSVKDFIHHLTSNNAVLDQEANKVFWEVYVKEDKVWRMKRMKKVLYFKEVRGIQKTVISSRFLYDADQLKIKGVTSKAQTHLIVKKVYNEQGKFIQEEVYNYAGADITKKFNAGDPARRILVFVNGYRPVANGGTPEEALSQIGNNGIEFPNSSNVLYDNDRFEYWRPWGAFDEKVISRIKPNEVYYADGHHSVETSNHGSVIYFAKAAAEYPKSCKGDHHCTYTETTTGTKVLTLSMLPFKSNKAGFNVRRKHGRIAGRNLYQLLNEVPGNSGNDTLFIVAHSMGYAYSLGMVDALKDKCNLGEFYIFAPENAEAGKVIQSDWEAVFQYGSVPKGRNKQAPCLQDGVAPQTRAKGLSAQNRLTFPESHYKKMGFTGSHFIGFYDWVFEIPQGEKGAIKQH